MVTKTGAARTLLLDLATACAVAELRKAEVRAILLKGPALARWLYDDPGQRSYVDIDLLVAPDRTDDALHALERLGYRDMLGSPTERGAIPHARVLTAPPGAATGIPTSFGEATGTVAVDLHHSFHGVRGADHEVWSVIAAGAEKIQLCGESVEVPAVPARAMFVALHAAADRTAGAQSFVDLDLALERVPDGTWIEAYSLAARIRAIPAFVEGLRMRAAGSALVERLGIQAHGDVPLRLRTGVMPPVAGGLERLRRTEGPSAKARLILRELFPTAEFMRHWSPLARRGPVGLAVAYASRPFWLLVKLPAAARAIRVARKDGAR